MIVCFQIGRICSPLIYLVNNHFKYLVSLRGPFFTNSAGIPSGPVVFFDFHRFHCFLNSIFIYICICSPFAIFGVGERVIYASLFSFSFLT